MIEWWIDIPNLQTVDLPYSFEKIKSKSITSIYLNNIEWIDVSPVLASILPFFLNDIKKLDSNITTIQIPNYSVNSNNYTIFNFSRFIFNYSRFKLLEELIIGNDCFCSVKTFKINRLNHLKSLKIGNNSFTHFRINDKWSNDKVNNRSRSFSILNCIELESIEIGLFSFSDYGGGFELKNLPKLSTIKIGEIGNDSSNFYYSSFVIKGIIGDMTLLMNRSS